jgi:hypothetical protein
MSAWADIDAHFAVDVPERRAKLAERIAKRIEERDPYTPIGSENGPKVSDLEESRAVWVHGSMRDFTDLEDAALVLAWFTAICTRVGSDTYYAYCILTFGEGGPRYRWEWNGKAISRMKGALDV